MSDRAKHVGRYVDRLTKDNPREVSFAERWAEENNERMLAGDSFGCTLEVLLGRKATQLDATSAATLMQWLGSNVGFSFMEESLRRAGYKIQRLPGRSESVEPATKSRSQTQVGPERPERVDIT